MNNCLVNVNGSLLPKDKAFISVFDRGFLFGDSVYEVTRTNDFVPFFLDKHLDRLYESAAKMDLKIHFSRQELVSEIDKTLKKLGLPDAYLRIIVTRGDSDVGLAPIDQSNNLVIIAKDLPETPKWWYEKGVDIITAQTIRSLKGSVDPSIKSGNYLNNVLAFGEANKLGAVDAVMLNHLGQVTEATTSNIWIVKDGQFLTPCLESGILGGLTRQAIISICHKENIQCREEILFPQDLIQADECFLTATIKQIVPVISIDGNPIGKGVPGPETLRMMKLYRHYAKISD